VTTEVLPVADAVDANVTHVENAAWIGKHAQDVFLFASGTCTRQKRRARACVIVALVPPRTLPSLFDSSAIVNTGRGRGRGGGAGRVEAEGDQEDVAGEGGRSSRQHFPMHGLWTKQRWQPAVILRGDICRNGHNATCTRTRCMALMPPPLVLRFEEHLCVRRDISLAFGSKCISLPHRH
jgi:hypothetical protein